MLAPRNGIWYHSRRFFKEHTIMNFMFSLTLALNLGLTARGGVACA